MTVHRRGIAPKEPPPHRKSLGKVLVTIDDLDALIDLLVQRDPANAKPVVEFTGGTIDEGEDMRKLTDQELSRLSIKAHDVEIVLAYDEAYCLGSEDAGTEIYTAWARGRPSQRAPKAATALHELTGGRGLRAMTIPMLIGIGIVVGAVVSVATGPGSNPDASTRFFYRVASATTLATIVGVGGAVALISILVFLMRSTSDDYAEIHAKNLKEYRTEHKAERQQLVTWLIAVSGLAVASTTAFVVALIKR